MASSEIRVSAGSWSQGHTQPSLRPSQQLDSISLLRTNIPRHHPRSPLPTELPQSTPAQTHDVHSPASTAVRLRGSRLGTGGTPGCTLRSTKNKKNTLRFPYPWASDHPGWGVAGVVFKRAPRLQPEEFSDSSLDWIATELFQSGGGIRALRKKQEDPTGGEGEGSNPDHTALAAAKSTACPETISFPPWSNRGDSHRTKC